MKKLENKVVFITGGSSGIGQAIAELARREGARVAIADAVEVPSQVPAGQADHDEPEELFIKCDVADPQSVQEAVRRTIDYYGDLHVAVNNAGIGGESNHVDALSLDGWRQVLDVNLNGVFYCMKYELEYFKKQPQGGCIINVSSVLGQVGMMGSSAYVAAKHGVLGLTKAAALEYALLNVRINALCPGFIETPMLTNAGLEPDNEVGKKIVERHPMHRLGTPQEVAQAFLWLASDDASFVTGTTLAVDGGYLAQ